MRFVSSGQSLTSQMHGLVQALVLRRAVELVQSGLRPPSDVTGLPQNVVELLRSSPSHLHAAMRAADAQIKSLKSQVTEDLTRRIRDRATDWDSVDREGTSICTEPSRGDIIGDAREEAANWYRSMRMDIARAPFEMAERVIGEFVEAHVRVRCLADLEAGKQPVEAVDLPGDQLLALGRPGGIRKLYMDAAEASIRHQDAMVKLVGELTQNNPHALAVCDHWVRELAQAASSGTPGAPREDAMLCASDVYFELRKKLTKARSSPITWLFTPRGRVTRLQYFVPALLCQGILIWLSIQGRIAATEKSQYSFHLLLSRIGDTTVVPVEPPSELLIALGFLAYLTVWWISVVLAIRRIRDMGRNVPLCAFNIISINAILLIGGVAFGTIELAMISVGLLLLRECFRLAVQCWLLFSPTRMPRLTELLGKRYSAVRWGSANTRRK